MKNLQKLFILIGLSFMLSSCQKDDICPPGTETTPRLVIEFYDIEDPSTLKAVEGLLIVAEGMEEPYLGPSITNTVSIPLRTDETVTQYSFIANSGTEEENEDIVTFTYDLSPEYINRACGYKINFNNIVISIHSDENNWLESSIILQSNVENETAAHISFTH